jgi:hypothetical protein
MSLREMLRSQVPPGTVRAVCSGTASRLQGRTNLFKRDQQLPTSWPVSADCIRLTCANDDTVKVLHCADVICCNVIVSDSCRETAEQL